MYTRVPAAQPTTPPPLSLTCTASGLGAASFPCWAAGASLLGLTAEPDAATLVLPPSPADGGCDCAFADDAGAAAAGSTCALDSMSSSSDSDEASSSSSSNTAASSSPELLTHAAAAAGAAAAPAGRHVLILACDGLWDMLPNEEAVSIALR